MSDRIQQRTPKSIVQVSFFKTARFFVVHENQPIPRFSMILPLINNFWEINCAPFKKTKKDYVLPKVTGRTSSYLTALEATFIITP